MKYSRRIVGAIVALILLSTLLLTFIPNAALPSVGRSFAQAGPSITIDGSNILASIVKPASDAFLAKNSGVTIQQNISGTDGGIDKLCKGQIDIAMASRPIKDSENTDCGTRNVKFVELVVAYDALVVVVNPGSPTDCLEPAQLANLLGPAAKGIKDWSSVTSAGSTTPTPSSTGATPVASPISNVYAAFDPAHADLSQVRTLAAALIGGNGLRDDLQPVDSGATVVAKVGSDPSAVGILTLADFQNTAGKAVKAVKLDGSGGCLDVSTPANYESLRYPATEALYLYVNASSLDRQPVSDFLNFVLGQDGQAIVINTGFVTAEASYYATDLANIKARTTGRSFSRIQAVLISSDTAGTVNIGGAAESFSVFSTIKSEFSAHYKNININLNTYGNEQGFQKLCSNGADMLGTTRLFTDDEAAACQKANIKTLQLPLGFQGVVLLVNSKNTFASCLTFSEIATLFGSASDGKVKKWSDVRSSFPANDLVIIAPADGSPTTDSLLNTVAPKPLSPTRRRDVVENDDPAYRATALETYPNAITYMRFSEYQKLNPTGVTLVSVDGGKGCVAPSQDNLINGTYPISQAMYAIFNLNIFTRADMKAWAWSLLSDDTLETLKTGGLVGTDAGKFAAAREIALDAFNQPVVAVATAGAISATGQPSGTSLPTLLPAAATAQATAQVTAQATAGQ